MNILIAGGGGYLGSHIYIALHNARYSPVIVDSFDAETRDTLQGLRGLLGHSPSFEVGSLQDKRWLRSLLATYRPDGAIYIPREPDKQRGITARLKDLHQRMEDLISLLHAMDERGARLIQMASTCEVYPGHRSKPLREDTPRLPGTIHGRDRLLEEDLITGITSLRDDWQGAVLRHFHVLGAHPSGCIGTSRRSDQQSLMFRLGEAALQDDTCFEIEDLGELTPDRSSVRDFIHVQDVAEAHVRSIETLLDYGESYTVNIGTGIGHSVLHLIGTMERTIGRSIPWRFSDVFDEGPEHSVADTRLCAELMGWRAQLPLDIMCADAWRWQRGAPPGQLRCSS